MNKLFQSLSASGAETKIRNYISEQIPGIFDTVTVDNVGNLIAHKSGNGEKICIECGMDSHGIMIVATEQSKAYFAGVGTVTPAYLANKKIVMENGEIGIIRASGEVTDSTKLSDMYIEIDTSDIHVGDFGTVAPDFCEIGDFICANGLSDVAALAALLKALSDTPASADLTVVFTVQKLLNGRGLRAFFGVNTFDRVYTLNCCEASGSVNSGNGCAVILKDKSAVASCTLRDQIKDIADKNSVKIQPCVSGENLFIGNITHGAEGNDCICLCIPVSYRGKTLEKILKADFDETVKLIGQIIKG